MGVDMVDRYEEIAVSADNLTKEFGSFVAVDHVTFEVKAGEIFGFLGPNGAGKTTTIKMMTGLLAPTAGQGMVAGYDIATDAEHVKRNIGYMSQLFSLYADMSVEENIGFYAGMYSVPGSKRQLRRDWVLEVAGLQDQKHRLTGELPLGIKQRLALGCAVLHEPPILFLDEPTSGVDPLSRRRFWDLIYSLTGEGTTVFVSTHYMEEAEYCNRLALMNRGKLIALNSPYEIRRSTSEPLYELNTDDSLKTVKALQGNSNILEVSMYGRSVHVTVIDDEQAEQEIRETLGQRGVRVLSMRRIQPSLEDAFVSKVRAAGGAPVD